MVIFMTFSEKLKQLRQKKGMTQEQLSEAIDVPKRSIVNYETGRSLPRDTNIYNRIAEFFKVSVDYLLSDKEEFIAKAYAEGGAKGKSQAEALVAEAGALFAGGSLSEEDKEAVFMALQEAYWVAKQDNRKYAPRLRGKKT